MNLPTPDQRLETLLRHVADELRPCKACGLQLAMVRHRDTGRVAPYDLEGETVGVNHFITCPKAEQFRRICYDRAGSRADCR